MKKPVVSPFSPSSTRLCMGLYVPLWWGKIQRITVFCVSGSSLFCIGLCAIAVLNVPYGNSSTSTIAPVLLVLLLCHLGYEPIWWADSNQSEMPNNYNWSFVCHFSLDVPKFGGIRRSISLGVWESLSSRIALFWWYSCKGSVIPQYHPQNDQIKVYI